MMEHKTNNTTKVVTEEGRPFGLRLTARGKDRVERISILLDKTILRILRHGRKTVDRGGNVLYEDPTAADLKAAIERLDQIRRLSVDGTRMNEEAEDMAARVKRLQARIG